MRDLLPAEAEVQGQLAARVLRTFELHGYQRVNLPAFEYADVLERGLGAFDPASMLRFVEPETGEVVALRPDMTPQVARLVATRLSDRPAPIRLSYRGSVLRRRHERARHDQQILQAGIELVGIGGVEADLEVISLCVSAVKDTGLKDFVLDLGHGKIASSLLSSLKETERALLLESLSLKDGAELERRARGVGLDDSAISALSSLLSLQGGEGIFERAHNILGGTSAWTYVDQLYRLYERIKSAALTSDIVIDLGESRSAAYYTGPTFQILAEGPGQAVASGGRYDELYGQFGGERSAAGFAIQLDHLRWAVGAEFGQGKTRIIVCVTADVGTDTGGQVSAAQDEEVNQVLRRLREDGIICIAAPAEDAVKYASAWRYSHILRVCRGGVDLNLTQLVGLKEVEMGKTSLDSLKDKLRA